MSLQLPSDVGMHTLVAGMHFPGSVIPCVCVEEGMYGIGRIY